MKDLFKWCAKNPTKSVGLILFSILQLLSSLNILGSLDLAKWIPWFLAGIFVMLITDSEKIASSIANISDRLATDKVEYIERSSEFFKRLLGLVNENSHIDVYYVSRQPLGDFGDKYAKQYLQEVEQLIKNTKGDFSLRRLIILNSHDVVKSVLEYREKFRDYQSRYVMKVIETDQDYAFTGYVIIDGRHCFVTLPRSHAGVLRCLYLDSEQACRSYLIRYEQIWDKASVVDDEFCQHLRLKYRLE